MDRLVLLARLTKSMFALSRKVFNSTGLGSDEVNSMESDKWIAEFSVFGIIYVISLVIMTGYLFFEYGLTINSLVDLLIRSPSNRSL